MPKIVKMIVLVIVPFLLLFCTEKTARDKKDSRNINESNAGISDIEWIQQEVLKALEENDIPALSIAIVKDGKVELLKGYGVEKRNSDERINEKTLYQIASLSKMFTGIITNKLVHDGILKLDESIVTYLPSDIAAGTKEKLKDIKVVDLLHHRSGLPRNSRIVNRIDGDPMVGGYSKKELIEDLNTLSLEFEPTARFEYSNLGYAVLDFILERASNQSYEILLEKYVVDEIGLKNTVVSLSNAQKPLLATPYRKDSRKKETKPWETGKLVSASGIYSNVVDLSALMIHQIEDYIATANKVDSYNLLMLTRQKRGRNTEGAYYGFGIFETKGLRGSVFGHGGDIDGFASEYSFSPEHNVGVVLLSSSGGRWIKVLSARIMKRLEEAAINEKARTITYDKK